MKNQEAILQIIPKRIFSNLGSSLIELMLAVGMLTIISLGTNSFIAYTMQQSGNVKRNLDRSQYERNLVSLLGQSSICTCNLSGLLVPATGSVNVSNLRSKCGGASDLYQQTSPGFPVDPNLLIQNISVSSASNVGGVGYVAKFRIQYAAPNAGAGGVGLNDGVFSLMFDSSSAATPFKVQTCALSAPNVTSSSSSWSVTGNSGLSSPANFLGSTDNSDIYFKRYNVNAGLLSQSVTSFGVGALKVNTGALNSAFGVSALLSNTTGSSNVAGGFEALKTNVTNSNNTAFGFQSLTSSTADDLTAFGSLALTSNTTGTGNTAFGFSSQQMSTTKNLNTSVGWMSLQKNASWQGDTAMGSASLQFENAWSPNVAFGAGSLSNSNGGADTAFGYNSMNNNTSANSTAVGANVFASNAGGSNGASTGVGANAGLLGGSYDTVYGANSFQSFAPTGFGTYFSADYTTAFGFNTLNANTSGTENTAFGSDSLASNTTGYHNTAFGINSLNKNTTGNLNTAGGNRALEQNTTGNFNTAVGDSSLTSNTTGNQNTAAGAYSLQKNTTGSDNTAIGYQALMDNTTGIQNTSIGYQALMANTTGSNNTAIGRGALSMNTTANDNTVVGVMALAANTTGSENSVVGDFALSTNSAGNQNATLGHGVLMQASTGDQNVGIGYQALYNSSGGNLNTAIGYMSDHDLQSGDNHTSLGAYSGVSQLGVPTATGTLNVYVGTQAGPLNGTSPNNAVAIGFNAKVGVDNGIVLGERTGGGAPVTHVGIGVFSPSTYQLELSTDDAYKPGTSSWTVASDSRLKNIEGLFIRSLFAIDQISPVYYHYKKQNPLRLPSSDEYVGIIAQDAKLAVPESVSVDQQSYLHVTIDAIFWSMLNAVKELFHLWDQDNNQLKNKLANLEDQTQQLESDFDHLKSQNDELLRRLCLVKHDAGFCE